MSKNENVLVLNEVETLCVQLLGTHSKGRLSKPSEEGLDVFTPYVQTNDRFIGLAGATESLASGGLRRVNVISIKKTPKVPRVDRTTGRAQWDRLSVKDFTVETATQGGWWSVAAPQYQSKEAMTEAVKALRASEMPVATAIVTFEEIRDKINKILDHSGHPLRQDAAVAKETLRSLETAVENESRMLASQMATAPRRFELDKMFILYQPSGQQGSPDASWVNVNNRRGAGYNNRVSQAPQTQPGHVWDGA